MLNSVLLPSAHYFNVSNDGGVVFLYVCISVLLLVSLLCLPKAESRALAVEKQPFSNFGVVLSGDQKTVMISA